MEPGCPPAGGWEAPGWMVLLAYGPEWRWALAIGPVGCGVGPGCKSHALRDGTVPVGGAEWGPRGGTVGLPGHPSRETRCGQPEAEWDLQQPLLLEAGLPSALRACSNRASAFSLRLASVEPPALCAPQGGTAQLGSGLAGPWPTAPCLVSVWCPWQPWCSLTSPVSFSGRLFLDPQRLWAGRGLSGGLELWGDAFPGCPGSPLCLPSLSGSWMGDLGSFPGTLGSAQLWGSWLSLHPRVPHSAWGSLAGSDLEELTGKLMF